MRLIHRHSPSLLNPQGAGEGGAIALPVVIANANCDALTPFKVELNRLLLKPERIRAALGRGEGAIAAAACAYRRKL